MSDVCEMRRRVHELVFEAGDILGAIETAGRHHGFTQFPIVSEVGGVDVSDTFGIKVWCDEKETTYTDKDILYVGSQVVGELKECANHDPGLSESACEGDISYEAGHVHKPEQLIKVNGRVVPYSLDEIVNSQVRAGLLDDENLERMETLQESQANIYALVKCHDGRTLEETLEHTAIRFWHNSIYPNYELLERKAPSGELRDRIIRSESHRYARSEGYSLWLKPDVLAKLADKVVGIDKGYLGKIGGKK